MIEKKCPHCGGSEIVANIQVEAGLVWETSLIVNDAEQLFADLCKGCGSVIRLCVQNTNRKWKTPIQ